MLIPRALGRRFFISLRLFNRTWRTASLVLVASLLLVANWLPVVEAQIPPPANNRDSILANLQTTRQAVASGRTAAVVSQRSTLYAALQDVEDSQNPQLGWVVGRTVNPCQVIAMLNRVLALLQRARSQSSSAELEELYIHFWTLRQDLVQSLPVGTTCDGVEPTQAEPAVKVEESNNQQLNFGVQFGSPTFTAQKGNGKTFTQVHLAGLEERVGQAGQPAIPVFRRLIAVPKDAKPVVRRAEFIEGTSLHINLVPFQPQAVDQTPGQTTSKPKPQVFADQPFVQDIRTYQTNSLLPSEPCKITPVGQYRDIQAAQLECTTAKYNPVTDEYIPSRGLNVVVTFEGGRGTFATTRSNSTFESSDLLTGSVLNKEAVGRYLEEVNISALPCWGEELLILTHSNFRAAADRLAEHKRSRGMSTNVFNVGSGVPSRDTAAEIDKFIENRYDTCKIRPSYVLLMGDAEFVPTFYPSGMPDNAGTDFPYSNYVQILFDAFFPDFGTGRVPVDTLAQANTVVDKIVKYEASPPFKGFGSGAPFYNTAGLASHFQCCRMNSNGTPLNGQAGTDQRAFVETSELVRQELVDRGYTVPRIYTSTVDNGGYCLQKNSSGVCTLTQSAYSGNTTPRRYYDGSLLPGDIGAGSGFAWTGSTTNIRDAWNAGRFLFLHRDHGWPGGWANPGFSTSDIDGLNNGDLLPVVWSVNCASGLFDNETAGGIYDTTYGDVYFAERALRKADGGAIGVIGDTRNSPTWANNALTRGFADAVFPDTIPSFGNNTSHKRLGDTLNWGKIYLANQVGVDQTAGGVSVDDMGYEYNIWHVIGDPSLSMWTRNPYRLVLSREFALETSRIGEVIHYKNEGANITKLEVTAKGETKALARGTVANGQANLVAWGRPAADSRVIYTASLDDSAGVVLSDQAASQTTR